MRKQYHTRHSAQAAYTWDVDKLIAAARTLPVRLVPIASIAEFDENWWYQGENDVPTCRSIAGHLQLVERVSLDYPIILSSEGRLMDGMHRVVKAFLLGRELVPAVRFVEDPPPDYTDVNPDDLPY